MTFFGAKPIYHNVCYENNSGSVLRTQIFSYILFVLGVCKFRYQQYISWALFVQVFDFLQLTSMASYTVTVWWLFLVNT